MGNVVCTGDELLDWAYLVLDGSCEERDRSVGEPVVLQVFKRGETFGARSESEAAGQSTVVVAAANCVLLRINRLELTNLDHELNSHHRCLNGESDGRFQNEHPRESRAGRLMTLVSLAPGIPAAWIGKHLAEALQTETGESVILVRLVPTGAGESRRDEAPGVNLSRGPLVLPTMSGAESGCTILTVGVPRQSHKPGPIEHLLATLRERYDHVLIQTVLGEIPLDTIYDCVAVSASAYLLLRPGAGDTRRLELLLGEFRPRLNSHIPVRLKPILCLSEGDLVQDVDARIERLGLPIHLHVHGCPKPDESAGGCTEEPVPQCRADIRRLARDMGDCLVGLVLSSGGAKGFAHIGVIQVLEEHGIEVDFIAGASMGAYVGAIWACGHPGTTLEKLAREMEGRWAMWSLIDPVFPPRRGFLRGYAVKQRLMRTIGTAGFADLTRPLRVVAANLNTLERVVFSTGEVAAAVHASIAVPGICVPVTHGEETYVDGGIVDPLPVGVLREMGVRHVIAVNTIPTPESIRRRLQQARSRQVRPTNGDDGRLSEKIMPLDKHLNYFARGNILEILMNSIHGAQIRVAEAACRHADIVLRPEICHDRWVDFRNPGTYIAAGREVALQHLEAIKALVRQKGKAHEHPSTANPLATVA